MVYKTRMVDAARSFESCSNSHCLAIDAATRRVISWGTRSRGNRFGQLGRGRNCQLTAALVERLADDEVVHVAAGGGAEAGHSAAVTVTGDVFTWGCDRWQQLGVGEWMSGKMYHATPQKARVSGIAKIACGDDHTIALSRDGATVFTWGRGEHGQLGRGATVFVGVPERSELLSSSRTGGASKIAHVVAVANCSATVGADGQILKTAGKCGAVQERLGRLAAALAAA